MNEEMISAKEFGEMSANVKTLLEEWREFKNLYATRKELETLQESVRELKADRHLLWNKVSVVAVIVSVGISAISLVRTFHG